MWRCNSCGYAGYVWFRGYMLWQCTRTKYLRQLSQPDTDCPDTRPSWCPLLEISDEYHDTKESKLSFIATLCKRLLRKK